MSSLKLSIIIVTYNCQDFIVQFLTELTSSLKDYEEYEILIIDNFSSDGTVPLIKNFPEIRLVASSVNLGFAKANNVLIKQSHYENILLLNPDVFGFSKSFWQQLYEQWDKKNLLFIRLTNLDGSFQDCVGEVVSIKRIFNNLFKRINYAEMSSVTEVEMGIMAFMIAPIGCFNNVGLLSEDYHMYAEDMDWCYRARKKKYKVLFNPGLSLTHWGGASAKNRWIGKKSLKVKYEAERIFIVKHFKGVHKKCMLFLNSIKLWKI